MATTHPDLTEALRVLDQDAGPAYDEAETFYEGVVDEVIASVKLKEILGDEGRNYRINYARTPVDVLMERTSVQGWTVSNAAQRTAIEQTWTDNELGIEAKDVHLKAYEYGDAYLVAWGEDDDPDFPGRVSAYCHGPKHVRVFYEPEKPRRKRMGVHRWVEAGDYDTNGLAPGIWQRVNVYYPDRVERYVSKEPVQTALGINNMLRYDAEYDFYVGDGQDGELENPYGIIPIFHFRTARPYGRPEHADAYGPQYGINKLYVSLMGHIDFTVLPQRYIATESDADQSTAVDPFSEVTGDYTPDEYGSEGLDASSSMETGPGYTWLLSGKNVRPGQFQAGDSKNFTEPLEVLVQTMADVTDLPSSRYHKGGEQPSGDSQRMSEKPLNIKAQDRHDQFGVTWHEFAQFICTVNNLGETDAQVAWAPPGVDTDKDSWETAGLQLAAGVPFDQVMRERGYDSEVVAGWVQPTTSGVAPNDASQT